MSLFLKRNAAALYPPRIACYVCGAEVPSDYPLYPEPPGSGCDLLLTATTPYFPFLLHHPPPLGCRPPSPGGMAKSCRVCYSTLMRQWDDYEKSSVPLDRRIYWFDRVDGLPVVTPELQLRTAAALQSRITQQQTRTAAALLHAAAAASQQQPPPLSPYDGAGRSHPRQKVVTSPLPVVGRASDLSGQHHLYWQPQASPQRRTVTPQTLPPPQSAPSSAPSSIIQLSTGDHGDSLLNVSSSSVSLNPPDTEMALDLSSGARERENVKSRSSVTSHVSTGAASHHSYQSEGGASASTTTSTAVTDILDLTLPDKNASFEVCYVCGDEFKRGTLTYAFARHVVPGVPFFTSLVYHPRPARSRPMDAGGRVQVCDDCHDDLIDQWNRFEEDEVAQADRNYALRKRSTPIMDTTTFVCYICALDYHSSSLRLLYSRPNTENEPYYPFIEQQKPPPGASPISPQGMVQVCTVCYKATKDKHHGFMSNEQPPLKKRRGTSHTFSLPRDPSDGMMDPSTGNGDDDERLLPADLTCPLCRRKFAIGFFLFLHTRQSSQGGFPYFPFLNDLPKPEELSEMEEDGQHRVRVCKACNTSLINQWTVFQREQVPIDERVYAFQSLISPRRSLTSTSSTVVAAGRPLTPSSMRSQRSGGRNDDSVSATRPRANSNTYSSATATPEPGHIPPQPQQQQQHRSRTSTLQSEQQLVPPASHSPSFSVHSSASNDTSVVAAHQHLQHQQQQQQASKQQLANASSFYCFLCGLHSELTFSRMLYSLAPGKKAPYFPFMKKHVPKSRAEALREDGTALVCTFCYHSVMMQWTRYNEIRSPQTDPSVRSYNLTDYRCYVCLITTNRKKIRALRVIDFPFLRDLKSRKNAIQMENGEMVAVCIDCFENLRNQFLEYSRRGFPMEKREYKWMQVPQPPDELSSSLSLSTSTSHRPMTSVATTSAAAASALKTAEPNPVTCS